jgi:predicted Zn-dependent protease
MGGRGLDGVSRRASSALSLIAGLALLGAVAGCSTNPTTGRTQLDLVGEQRAAQLGIQSAPQLVEEFGGEVPNAELRNYVTEVGMKLKDQTEVDGPQRQWRFYLLDSDVINAFALPGEQIFISRGLADQMTNEAQLAGVLGHEIGHVMAKHSAERMSQGMLAQIGVGIAGIFGGGSEVGQLAVQGGQLFVGGTLLKFSRDQESEADSLGMRYMAKAGYNPRGQLQVMEILDRAAGGGNTPEILATHPLPKTRIDRVGNELRTTYANTQSGPEAGNFQFFEDRFQRRYLAIARTVPVKKSPKPQGLLPGATDGNGRTRLLASIVWEDPMTWCGVCQSRAARGQTDHVHGQ